MGPAQERENPQPQPQPVHPPLVSLVPQLSPEQLLIGLTAALREIGTLKRHRAEMYDRKEFISGRIMGMAHAIAFILDLPYDEVTKIILEADLDR